MGTQGECARDKTKDEILLFSADNKKRKRSEFIEELVKKRKEFAKNTFYKYLDELVDEKKMKMEPGSREDFFRPLYSITKLGLKEVGRINVKKSLTNSFDVRALNSLSNLINRILEEKRDPYMVLNKYCFVFMGEMPFAFTKAPGALSEHIAKEKRLRKRFHEDIEKFEEEFFRTRVENAEGRREFLKAWKEEFGVTITEYYRKLKKRAEKMPFPQSMWLVEGYSDKEIEKMLAEDEEQYARMQKHKGDS